MDVVAVRFFPPRVAKEVRAGMMTADVFSSDSVASSDELVTVEYLLHETVFNKYFPRRTFR